MFVNTAFALPFSIWMLRSFLASVPRDIEDAAIVDGASTRVVLTKIMLPLIAPGIASVAVFAFVSSWTEYLFASVMIVSDANRTIPVGFAGIIGQYQIDWGLLLAGATLAIVPVVILFALVGRNFVSPSASYRPHRRCGQMNSGSPKVDAGSVGPRQRSGLSSSFSR